MLMSAPAFRNTLTACKCLWKAAKWSAVFPHEPWHEKASGMHPKNFVGIESLVSVGVGSSERESDDSVSVDTNASHSTDLSLETAHLPAGSKDMGNGWIWDASIQRFMKKERTMKKEERVAKWVQTATGAWEQAAPKRLPVEPGFDEVQTGDTGGRRKKTGLRACDQHTWAGAWSAVLGGHGGALGRFRVRLSGEGLPVHIAGLNRISLWQIGQDQNRAKSSWPD